MGGEINEGCELNPLSSGRRDGRVLGGPRLALLARLLLLTLLLRRGDVELLHLAGPL